MNAALDTTVDARNPWLGLSSFTEETRAYFFGREEEVAELARRVQRKLLTVLFGQSGLGKTSILRAGLVPKLRAQGYCPVYVRIDYGSEAPSPSTQIKQAIAATARAAGTWTQAGVAEGGESLWEFLHHRDDVLQDGNGQTLTPLIIFDQFEEIFTLAQSDDAGRARAARFIEDLADLVENRPPRELEARLDTDDEAAARFDFARSDYRVLIALREDYLAPLEGLKKAMPSIAQNRLRLAPMTGRQALAAVLQPGKGLVNQEVAEAIVRFVAGGAEVQNAEVEPALLSLVCRELNDARLAANRPEISPDLLKGSQDTILSTFYERSLADQPPAVRPVIEDQLLTASGFRENIAEERLLAAFKAAGAPPPTLATLVNRRLLRVEERLDLRRVELTHDVLCGVVRASRDLRQEREAREAADRQLAEQRAKELSARRVLVRARQVATVCAVLSLVALAAAVVAVWSTHRARRAEAESQQARVQAENLVGYLSDDFARELRTFGNLIAIEDITRRQVAYFRGLPAGLKGPESIRNGALALVSLAGVERGLGHQPASLATAREAIALLEQSRQAGDTSVATTVALSRAYGSYAHTLDQNGDPESLAVARKSLALIQPLGDAPDASERTKDAYIDSLTGNGFVQQQYVEEWPQAVKNLSRARELAAGLGAREVRTAAVAADYVSAAVWEAETLQRQGKPAESEALGREADGIAERVLKQRPDYKSVLHDAQILETDLANDQYTKLDPAGALADGLRALDKSRRLLARDPHDSSALNNASVNYLGLADATWASGDFAAWKDWMRQSYEVWQRVQGNGNWFLLNSLGGSPGIALHYADAGFDDNSRLMVQNTTRTVTELKEGDAEVKKMPGFAECSLQFVRGASAMGLGQLAPARDALREAHTLIQGLDAKGPHSSFLAYNCDYYAPLLQGEAELMLGDDQAAFDTLDTALTTRAKYPPGDPFEQRAILFNRILRALALARLGRRDEAQAAIEPELRQERTLAARNKGDGTQFTELAVALYAASLADPAHGAALRREALGVLDKLPGDFHRLRSVNRWRDLIRKAG